MTEITNETIKAYALENATKHNGKANQGAVLSGLFAEGLEKSDIKKYISIIQEIVNEVNFLSPEEQEKQFSKLKGKVSKRETRVGLPELQNAIRGKVVMRFAPYPSGALHIGNLRTLILNDQYVKDYDGQFILVMDDTIGSEKKQIHPDSYKLIEDGINWLGCKVDKTFYKSDRIQHYYKYAEELLRKGYLYVCSCPAEIFRELKISKKDCPCRTNKPERNLLLWKQMFDKNKSPEGSLAVRLKTDMTDPDPAFRDRVMFRISDRIHPRIKNKFRVYPTMEFSWSIDNHVWGITHILRGVDLDIEGRVEEFIRDIFKWSNPEIIRNGFLVVDGVKISKSKGLQEVKSGVYRGWDDPRLWSIQSLKARGIRPEAIREFILEQGVKQSNTTVPVDILYKINKKYIEHSPRYFFIESPQKINIKGSPTLTATIPLHPDNTLGNRQYETTQEFLISETDYNEMKEGNYRLMHLLNFKVFLLNNKLSHPEFSFISEEPNAELHTKYIQWLPADSENIKVEIIMPDGKITKGLGEEELKNLPIDTIIQFERFGFVRLNKKTKDRLEFFYAHK